MEQITREVLHDDDLYVRRSEDHPWRMRRPSRDPAMLAIRWERMVGPGPSSLEHCHDLLGRHPVDLLVHDFVRLDRWCISSPADGR